MNRATVILLPLVFATLLAPSAFAHRHYDPEHGRWLQRDPAGYVDGMNLYEYVGSGPVSGLDPRGLRKLLVMARAFIGGFRCPASPNNCWIPQPYSSKWEMKSDNRSFGQHGYGWITPPGPSRLYSDIFIESTKIGSLSKQRSGGMEGVDWEIRNIANVSTRRLVGPPPGTPMVRQATLDTNTRSIWSPSKCSTRVSLSASAGYPFVTGAPNIDYDLLLDFEAVGVNKVRISWRFAHNQFPDYELNFDSGRSGTSTVAAYNYKSPLEGPGYWAMHLDADLEAGSKTVTAETPKCCHK